MKLSKILEGLAGKTPVTTKVDHDPTVGSTTWSVKYTPDFTGVIKSYNRLISDLEKAIKENKLEDDVVMKDVILKAKANRSFLHKTLKRKYPDFIEKLSNR